ncbi:MAG: ABC transporter ATP-binding protein [Betaproteobacteria bacterium]
MARIQFHSLEKRFGTQRILAPLDLVIEDGEFFTFVGPSGCGKSTLLAMIAGIERPSAGSIAFDAQPIDGLAPGERDVAMVFQSYALYPHLTVRQNIAFPLQAKKVARSKADAAVAEVARALGLESLMDRKPRELSGGQRQRVALGRALVRKPRVFLMDEPLSNLDAQLRVEMREEIRRLHQTYGITTIYVTHDQEEAMALSDRMAVLRDGKIQQCDAPQAIYENPASRFVAQFIGSPPINVLRAENSEALTRAGVPTPPPTHAGEMVLAVRPADVSVHNDPRPDALDCEVLSSEPTGSDLWVIGSWQGQRIKGRAAVGFDIRRGTRAYFQVPKEKLYWFDLATGARVGR